MIERELLPTDTHATPADILRIWSRIWGHIPPCVIATKYEANEDILDLTQVTQ